MSPKSRLACTDALNPSIQRSQDNHQNGHFAKGLAHHFENGLADALHAECTSQFVCRHNLDVITKSCKSRAAHSRMFLAPQAFARASNPPIIGRYRIVRYDSSLKRKSMVGDVRKDTATRSDALIHRMSGRSYCAEAVRS
jgi:hypothetical protein